MVQSKINSLVGLLEPHPATVNRRKLAWFGGMSLVTIACPEPSFRALERVGDVVDGRKKMLDGQNQRVDIPAHARAAPKGSQQKRLEEDLC